jgi:hypothetical protein
VYLSVVYRRVAFGSSGLLLAAIHRNHPPLPLVFSSAGILDG